MRYVYILRSQITGKFYIGSTVDLGRRLEEHQRGHSPYTRGRGPWVLAYQESYPALQEARNRELQIKSWKSHRQVEDLISHKLG